MVPHLTILYKIFGLSIFNNDLTISYPLLVYSILFKLLGTISGLFMYYNLILKTEFYSSYSWMIFVASTFNECLCFFGFSFVYLKNQFLFQNHFLQEIKNWRKINYKIILFILLLNFFLLFIVLTILFIFNGTSMYHFLCLMFFRGLFLFQIKLFVFEVVYVLKVLASQRSVSILDKIQFINFILKHNGKINEIYFRAVLFIFIDSFDTLTITSYKMSQFPEKGFLSSSLQVLWGVQFFVPLLVVVYTAVETTKQVKKMTDNLRRAVLERGSNLKDNAKLWTFFLFKKEVKFTVWGFIVMDYQAIFSMLVAVTTYTLILVELGNEITE